MADTSYIADTLGLIDGAVASYAETVFTALSGPINTVLAAAGVFGLAWIAANAIFAFAPINFRSYLTWAVRYVVVVAVATSWSQFLPIYEIITEVPSRYGASLLNAVGGVFTNADSLNEAMDGLVSNIFEFSDKADDEAGWLGISITAVLLMVLGALMACVAILVSAIAKIGLALAVSLGPIMITAALFGATRSLFESWTRFTLGFAMIPLILAGIMGAILGIADTMTGQITGASELSQAAGFIIVILAAIFMMKNIPSLATGLAGSIVAAGTGIAEARSAMSQAASIASGVGGIATAPIRAGFSLAARADAGQQAAAGVQERGGGRAAQSAAFVTQAVRMSKDRQRFSDPSFLQPGKGGSGTSDNKAARATSQSGGSNPSTSRNGSASRLAQRQAIINNRRS